MINATVAAVLFLAGDALEFFGSFLLAAIIQMVGIAIVLLMTHGLALFIKLFWKGRGATRLRIALVLVGIFDFGTTILWLLSDVELQRHLPIAVIIKSLIYLSLFRFFGEDEKAEAAQTSTSTNEMTLSETSVRRDSSGDANTSSNSVSQQPILGANSPDEYKNVDRTQFRNQKRSIWKRWFWSPPKNSENSAQTVIRVLGNIFRTTMTVFVAFILFVASIVGYFFAKEERPEWFGSAHLTTWCDNQYGNKYYKHDRSDEVCADRWSEYAKFIAACDSAEIQTRYLLRTDCDTPKRPAFDRLQAAYGSGYSTSRSDPIAAANAKRVSLKNSLSSQLSTADFTCKYATSQFDRRRCQLQTESVNETELELAQLEKLIAVAEIENQAYYEALSACLVARRDRSREVREQVIKIVETADSLSVGLNIGSCADRAKDWAPGIYGSE